MSHTRAGETKAESGFRVVALIASYNEERYIAGCLEHLISEGVEVHLTDNGSTDATVEIARRYLGRGLVGLQTTDKREDFFDLAGQLERKEELAAQIEADWFIHQDVDEIRQAHRPGLTLREAFREVDAAGYNAVNFLELTFAPTREEPDHDHPDFLDTMRSYYPFMRRYPNQIKAWKKQPERVEIVRSGGHRIGFPEQLLFPEPFIMRHYPYLSVDHFVRKYLARKYAERELARGWHGWRTRLAEDRIKLPPARDLNTFVPGEMPDLKNPRFNHLAQSWTEKDPVGSGRTSRNAPIIVGGCYRSGTSLVRRILNSHSRIYCGPEVKFFRDLHGDYIHDPLAHGRFMNSARHMVSEEEILREIGGGFLKLQKRATGSAGKQRWADKNPENVLHLGEWETLLGRDWVFLHVVRNPLDTLASIKEIGFPLVVPPDLDGRIALYNQYLRAGMEFGRRHPDRYLRLSYEDLTREPEATTAALMAWLSEEFEPGQMEFNRATQQRGIEDPKVAKTTGVHANSVGRWREILTPEESARIRAECFPLWEQGLAEGEIGEAESGTLGRMKGRLKRLLGR